MLTATPKSFLSWNYEILDAERHVASVDLSWFRERGEIELDGERFQIGRESVMSGEFFLDQHGAHIATARKPSMFHRRFEVRHDGKTYGLRAVSAFRRRFVLEHAGVTIGEVRPLGIFTRSAAIDLPEALPAAVRIFIAWLVVLLWRRQHNSN